MPSFYAEDGVGSRGFFAFKYGKPACRRRYGAGRSHYLNRQGSAMLLDLLRVVGLIGVGFILVAYFANQRRWLSSEDWRFPAANLAGSLLILASLFVEWNTPSVVIEICWIAISVYGLFNRPRMG
jgi:hypothetical protein